jgi:hypothetical protein
LLLKHSALVQVSAKHSLSSIKPTIAATVECSSAV